MAIPKITPYTGTVPNKATQTKEEFATNIHTTHQFYDTSFVTEFNVSVDDLNLEIGILNASMVYNNYKGDWVIGTTYNLGDSVSYSDEVYYSKIDSNTDNTPPLLEDANWRKADVITVPSSGGYDAIASGAIASGEQIVVNLDGTVSALLAEETGFQSGNAEVFNSVSTYSPKVAYDELNQKVVVVYRYDSSPYYIYVVVGTISDLSITFGTPVLLVSGDTKSYDIVFDSTNNKVVIAYRDHDNLYYGTAVVGTVSGTSISFGTPTVFAEASADYISGTFDSTNNKVVIAYTDNDNLNYCTAVVGTVSGTSISFGTPVVFPTQTANSEVACCYDANNEKTVIVYKDNGNLSYGTAVVGTVSGTSISFGTPVVFKDSNTRYPTCLFDESNNKIAIIYTDHDDSQYMKLKTGEVFGNSVTLDDEITLLSSATTYKSSVYIPISQQITISFTDFSNLNYGNGMVISLGSITTNADDFIGYSSTAAADGDTINALVQGSVVEGLSGLITNTQYYVDYDGTLRVTATNWTSNPIGTALSSTQILLTGAGNAINL